jgi:hypothetical protein
LKKLLKYSFLVLALALTTSIAAHARGTNPLTPEARQAPEVDPSLAVGGFSLLAGTLTVLRARRHN